ncbi:MAG: DUF3108 domain-containing protein [Pseudomonadota bacterium]
MKAIYAMKRFLKGRLPIGRIFLLCRRSAMGVLLALSLIALAGIGAPTANASSQEDEQASTEATHSPPPQSLTPYEATYKTSTAGLSIKLHRSLTMDESGDCKLTSDGKLLVAAISEVSVFDIQDTKVRPKSYVYQLSGPVNRRREVHFDSDSGAIRSLYKKNWYDLPPGEDTLDRMSQQEQLRLTLMNMVDPRQDISFSVADGRKVKLHKLRFTGSERLETPMGWIDTLHFERIHRDSERRSAIWLAPDWDFLMVRTLHIEDGKTTEADLISASLAGQDVVGDSA